MIEAEASRLAVLVPLKPLREAKSRLRPVLDDRARAALVQAMLEDLLTAVRAAHAGPLFLVSSDPAYDATGARFEAGRLPDLGTDYRSAAAGALRSEAVRQAGAAMVLPADLPYARPADVAAAIEALAEAAVVLVPATDGGTGLLGLRPPDAIAPAFGPRSADAHLRATAAAGLRVTVLNCPSLAHDIDAVDDLTHGPGPLGAATQAFLAAHAVIARAC
jgi:2-phospho-L-lactate guanylyltransferase